MNKAERIALGAAWMGLTIISFATTAVAIREMAGRFEVMQMLFMRSIVGIIVLAPLVIHHRAWRTGRPLLQVGRNLAHFFGQYCWTLGVVLLPLAEVFALEFTTPIFVALLAAPLLGEPLTRGRLVAVFGGFIGVLIVLRPGLAVIDPAAFIVLAAACGFAVSVITTKKLTLLDGPLTILIYMCVIQLPIGGLLSLPDWRMPETADLHWIILFGIASLTAHLGMVKAFTYGDASVMMPIDFLRLPAITIVGYLLYDEALVPWVLLGAGVIFAANYYNLNLERRGNT